MTSAAQPFLPYGRQLIDDEDVAAVTAVLRSDFLTTGPAVGAFEAAFAERTGARFAVACSSGTAALHLAALALGLGPGDAVLVPSLTFVGTANAARYVGAEVVFADVDAETGLMTGATLAEALARAEKAGEAPKAAFPVHLNGQCADMPAIRELAAEWGMGVVEDACHVLGGAYGEEAEAQPVGCCLYSDMTVFSLHSIKSITMGEGGIVTTNDPEMRDRLVRYRNHGFVHEASAFENLNLAFDTAGAANPWYREMPEPGFNYRASDIHCALGRSQLAKLGRFVAAREGLVARYDRALAPLAPAIRPLGRVAGCQPAWHLYVVLIDFDSVGHDRSAVMARLRGSGIGTQVHYLPVHLQPYYRRRYGNLSLPGAESYYARALSLPLFAGMSEHDVDRVVSALEEASGA